MVEWKAGISLNLSSHNCNGFSGEKVWIAKPLRPNLNISKNKKITKLKMLTSKEDSNYIISTSAKDISVDIVDELLPDALVWASLHGLVVGDKTHPQSGKIPGVGLIHAPFSLLPTSFSEIYWNQACELVPLFNDVVDRVSSDGAFLQETLSRTKEFDDFTARLLNIHSTILDENIEQNVRLGIHRSDYMVDTNTRKLLQIELNTISASFSGLSSLVSELHRHLIDSSFGKTNLESKCIPKNFGIQKTAEALALTWKEFNDRNSVILVVILPEEHNMYDQHWICMELKRSYGVSTIRMTLSEINAEVKLSSDRTLYIGGKSVAVVYYRAGYAPEHYPSEEEWKARLTLEQSSAVKCPSISYHLSGTKKIQQELAKDGVLEKFVDDKEAIVKLRNCFAGLWSLDGDQSIIQDAIREPDLFVLKPQREGGGNNIYGNDIREKLLEIERKGSGHAAYILMQRIFPPTQKSYLVRNGVYQHVDTVSELGIYGVYLRNKDKVVRNEQGGYLMRTKVSTSNEGGVAAGFAVVDSLYID